MQIVFFFPADLSTSFNLTYKGGIWYIVALMSIARQ
jgi:hypothetical protein